MNVAIQASETGLASDVRAINALHSLVGTPSVSGDESAAVELFIRLADDLGFRAMVDGAGNAIARRGARDFPRLTIVLLGHIDTVPGVPPVRLEGGVLHGRGSVDAKGPICAMLFGAARGDVPDDVEIIVAGAVGEETYDSPGARFLRDTLRPDLCIVAEPSGWDGVTLGYKGRLVARARCERALTHTAGPERSAPDEVLAWWCEVEALASREREGAARAFDAIQSSVRAMHTTSDGLVETATMELGFRLPPDLDPNDLENRLRRLAANSLALEFIGHESAHVSTRADPVVRALSLAIRDEGAVPRPKVKTGTADLNVVAPIWRCPIAAYGPGDSALDHTPHEHLEIDDYLRSIRVIARALRSLSQPTRSNGIGVSGPSSDRPQ